MTSSEVGRKLVMRTDDIDSHNWYSALHLVLRLTLMDRLVLDLSFCLVQIECACRYGCGLGHSTRVYGVVLTGHFYNSIVKLLWLDGIPPRERKFRRKAMQQRDRLNGAVF